MQRSNTTILDYLGSEPITLEEAKEYLRVFHNNDDNYISSTLIPGARSFLERYMHISMIEKRVKVSVQDSLPNFMLPYWPVNEIEISEPAGLSEINGCLDNKRGETINITYITKPYILPNMKQALLNLISHWYITRDMSEVPKAVYNLVQQDRRTTWLA